ncbi:MAG: glycosyltransferase family 4 protein, partial [Planctomycetota bacterium]|nr:glycosyltransferase family 4 protein [Planctomycetota bacterium]
MRALWLIRRSLEEQPGGDTIQVLRTAEALGKLGVEITMTPTPGRNLEHYDVVHLFHLDRLWENLHHCRMLRTRKIPTLLTPIFWASDAFDRYGRSLPQRMIARSLGTGALRNIRLAYQWADQIRRVPSSLTETRLALGFRRGARAILRSIDRTLPASVAEQRALEKLVGLTVPSTIVPAGADNHMFHLAGAPATRTGVLCAGRIEPRKNQLALIRALRDTEIPLTLAGKPGPTAGAYARQCRKESGKNVRFLEGLTPDEIAGTYREARVHALVSWYETPGLASLEAALCGCSLVATEGGCTVEYLGQHARYCQPDNPASIRRAVLEALEEPPSNSLRER